MRTASRRPLAVLLACAALTAAGCASTTATSSSRALAAFATASAGPTPAAKVADTGANRFQPMPVHVITTETKTIGADGRWDITGHPVVVQLSSLTIAPGGSITVSSTAVVTVDVGTCKSGDSATAACGLQGWFADGTGSAADVAPRVMEQTSFWSIREPATFGLTNHTEQNIVIDGFRLTAG